MLVTSHGLVAIKKMYDGVKRKKKKTASDETWDEIQKRKNVF
jgi:hypothetical protein